MYRLMDLMPGARNLVISYAQVKNGDNVCVYADTCTDDLVVEAVAAAAREAGANVTVCVSAPIDDPGGSAIVEPPKVVRHAMYGADVILSLVPVYTYHWSVRTVTTALIEHGSRLFYIGATTPEAMASPWAAFPPEIDLAIGRKVADLARKGCKSLRIRDEKGTDITARYDPRDVVGAIGPRTQPGNWNIAPKSVIGITHFESVDGVACPDVLEITGPLSESCKWVIEGGWVTDIQGGKEASKLREWVFNINNANLLSEIMWGLNPKGSRSYCLQPPWSKVKMEMLTRTSGTLHLAMGSPPSREGGDLSKASEVHTHGVWLRPSIYAGDRPIIEQGHLVLLDDPEIRSIAKKYGNPNEVLAELP